ncbi:unnamed protein product [Notodromas monacha]|uniref:Uncharacterized protein n=1 Tax=Notodromas monacha TaxID=399045 RepID=A0A7R9BY22_9CRUS|nr:unnamed protein product [Notodromas monacha]CAG0922930.1 unnamed protein product [Notodromas monacha]
MKRGGAVPRMRPLPLAILWLLLLCTTSASSREFSKKQGNRNQAFSAAMNYAPSWASSSGMHTKEPGRPSYSLGAPVLRATMSAQRPVSPETVKKRISVCLRVLNNILPGYSSDQSAEVCARLASRSTTGTNNNNNNDNNNNKKTPDPSNGNKGTRRPKDYLFMQMEELERLVGKTRELEKSLLNNIAARRMLIAKSSKQGSANLPVLGLGKKPGSEKPKIISHGIRELEKNANVAFLESQLAAGTFNDLDFLDITKAVFATTQFTPKTNNQ